MATNSRGQWGESFWRNTKAAASGCIEWLGPMYPLGYGRALIGGTECKEPRAHRRAWLMVRGPIPEGMSVLHRCDNRACVNPEHLFIGTQSDNVKDMERKGRGAKVCGTAHHRTSITDAQVQEIRRAYDLGGSLQKDLAVRYGLCQTTVSRIVRRESWGHVQ